jgi:hypothetical protein
MNVWLNPLLITNADKIVVIKYQMNWPGSGDPYYTAEGGTRKTYYGVNSVPYPLTNGVPTNTQSSIQNAINTGYAQPAEATITGTFKITGNNITIAGNVTPTISGSGYKIYVVVNEKMTTQNKTTNGEKEFHHVMMKMFPNGGGEAVTLVAGTPIPFNYTHNMATTHVEEMFDLEVVVFVQNVSTKAILNAAYLQDITLPAPQTVTATQTEIDNLNVNITWTPPAGTTIDGYNVYRDNVKLNTSLLTGTSYQDVAPEYGKRYTYSVCAVSDENEGYSRNDTALINITMPKPVVTVKHVRGMKMLVEWTIPQTSYPVKYYVYRNGIKQNSNLIQETSFESTGASYREYCFEIEPVYNEVTGAKSDNVCVTLIKIAMPTNLKATQVSPSAKDVFLTWNAPSNAVGYNIYRDDVQINTELVTALEYTDTVPEYDVKYTYQVYGVASTGGEGESGATVSITLVNNNIPIPVNVQATQQANTLNVSVTWDPVPEVNGHNIYRNNVKINTETVTGSLYSDVVPAEGNYCYKITSLASAGESEKSDSACVNILDISEIERNSFTIYPNPVSGTLNIKTEYTITDCSIFNMQGQLIYTTQSGVKEISTEQWASGVYIIRIVTEKGVAEQRFTKN